MTAQKILSCVARTGERFGVKHVVDVLQGANTDQIRKFKHDQLSTYGLLKEMPKKQLQSMVYQLVDQGLLSRSEGEYPVLALERPIVGRAARPVIRAAGAAEGTGRSEDESGGVSWDGVDRGLFDHLRDWRRRIAVERQVPAYVVLHDATLMDLARVRPTELDVSANGSWLRRKAVAGFGRERRRRRSSPIAGARAVDERVAGGFIGIVFGRPDKQKPKPQRNQADGPRSISASRTIEEVMSYTSGHAARWCNIWRDYIAEHRPERIDAWVDPETYQRVVCRGGRGRIAALKPLHEQLGGAVSYDAIRLVMTHLQTRR